MCEDTTFANLVIGTRDAVLHMNIVIKSSVIDRWTNTETRIKAEFLKPFPSFNLSIISRTRIQRVYQRFAENMSGGVPERVFTLGGLEVEKFQRTVLNNGTQHVPQDAVHLHIKRAMTIAILVGEGAILPWRRQSCGRGPRRSPWRYPSEWSHPIWRQPLFHREE